MVYIYEGNWLKPWLSVLCDHDSCDMIPLCHVSYVSLFHVCIKGVPSFPEGDFQYSVKTDGRCQEYTYKDIEKMTIFM